MQRAERLACETTYDCVSGLVRVSRKFWKGRHMKNLIQFYGNDRQFTHRSRALALLPEITVG